MVKNNIQLDDIIFFRKNNINLKSNIINSYKEDETLKFFIKKILIAENAFKEFTKFEKWVQEKRLKHRFNRIYLFYKDTHWWYGKKGIYAQKVTYWLKKWYISNFSIQGKKILRFFSWPQGLKFFGGYTYWYGWFQDYKQNNERYLYENYFKYKYYVFRWFNWVLTYKKDIYGRKSLIGWTPNFKHFKYVNEWYYFKPRWNNTTFDSVSRMNSRITKRLFKGFILSNDIWNTHTYISNFEYKKDFIKKMVNSKNGLDFYRKKIYISKNKFIIDKKPLINEKYVIDLYDDLNFSIKELLIRKPVIRKSLKAWQHKEGNVWKIYTYFNISNIPGKYYSFDFSDDRLNQLLKELTTKKFWRWVLHWRKFRKIRKPYGFTIFADENWSEKYKGLLNIYCKKLLKITNRGIYLINKSEIYSKKAQIAIQGYWVNEFSKDFLHGDRKKFFIMDTLKFKKIITKDFLKHVKNNDNLLLSSMYKNYSILWNNYNKDSFFFPNFDITKQNDYYETSYIKNYWEKDFYKKKKNLL